MADVIMDDKPNDRLLKSIPIYLTEELSNQLYLFQFPIKKTPFKEAPTGARMKIENKKVELDIPIDTNSPSYDTEKGTKLASNIQQGSIMTIDSNSSKGSNKKNEKMVDKSVEIYSGCKTLEFQTWGSTRVPHMSKYMIGVLKDDELHLTPFNETLQLRPTLKYLDIIDSKDKSIVKQANEEEDTKVLNVQLMKKESQEVIEARKKSSAYIHRKEEEEPWTSMDFMGSNDDRTLSEFKKLFCDEKQEIQLNDDVASYLKNLSPVTFQPELPSVVNYSSGSGLCYQDLLKLNLDDQLSALLMNSNILPFQRIKELVTATKNDALLAEALQKCAWLIQGRWIIKSELKYSSESIIEARNHLLFLFSKSPYVQRKEFVEKYKLPTDQSKELFTNIAQLRPGKGWELKFAADVDFLSKFPHVEINQTRTFQELYK